MKKRIQIGLLAALLLPGFSSLFAGTNQRPIDIPERAEGSDKVVVGTIQKITSRWETTPEGDRRIMSLVDVAVEETLDGTAEPVVTMDVEGGTVDGITMQCSVFPKLAVGERTVLFLDPPEKRVRRPHLKGLGILKLDRTNRVQRTSLTLEQIRAKTKEGRMHRRGHR